MVLKTKILSVICFFALLSQAHAANYIIWRGSAHINGATGTCPDYDPKGQTHEVRYQPAGLGDNGVNNSMGWFISNSYAQSWVAPIFDATWRPTVYESIWTASYRTPYAVSVRFLWQSPTRIAVDTPFIQVSGQIYNYDFMQGCLVNFNMMLTKAVLD